jgi:deoxyribodipyrimidine photolyase-related protein
MQEAVVIYPHQLFATSPALVKWSPGHQPVYLVEEPLLLTHNPIHRQKLLFHKLTLDAYETKLRQAGHTVIRLTIQAYPETMAVFDRLHQDGVERMHIVDTTDDYLEQAIAESGIKRVWYESPLFLLDKQDAIARFTAAKRFMASFYKQLRKDREILIDNEGQPVGGQWSFDTDNRQKIPRSTPLPTDIAHFGNPDTTAAEAWVATVTAEQYGELGVWFPYTHEGAQRYLNTFLKERFRDFGPYEDAMTTRGVRLWHSALSPLLNVGLLTPQHVLNTALAYADTHKVPLNSLEGFVRQILGWREFMRASYEVDGRSMRQQNFFKHHRTLPASFWTGQTNIAPLDHVINTALSYGYTHHIERLMVMGNFMLLSQIHPTEVYRWFMGMYLDAYDWVMVPNVYGMSQFADGGSFATKPYISGANYIKKMSDFKSGDWEDIWTALYWHFIDTHQEYFSSNHRLSMMWRLLDRMPEDTRQQYRQRAQNYLANQG